MSYAFCAGCWTDNMIVATVNLPPTVEETAWDVFVISVGWISGAAAANPSRGEFTVTPEPDEVPGCPIPTNFKQNGFGKDTGNGTLHFDFSYDSSTGALSDLAACVIGERVAYSTPLPFPPPFPPVNPDNPTVNNFSATSGGFVDDQMTPGTFVKPYSSGTGVVNATQDYRWYCPCYQNGNWQYIAKGLGIYRTVQQDPSVPGNWVFSIIKPNISPVSGFSSATINPLPK